MTPRQKAILGFLLSQKTYISAGELSERFFVSKPTVRNDLRELASLAKRYGLDISHKRGSGYRLDGEGADRNDLRLALDNDELQIRQNEENRNILILYHLIEGKGRFISAERLGNELSLSSTKIRTLIREINGQIAGSGVRIVSRRRSGYALAGEERAIRKLYVQVFTAGGPKPASSHEPIYERIMDLTGINPEIVVQAIRKYEKDCQIRMTDESFSLVVIHVAIALKRIAEGSPVHNLSCQADEESREWKAVMGICASLEEALRLHINKSERCLMYLYASSARIRSAEKDIASSSTERLIAQEIITLVKNVKQAKINEAQSYQNLLMHIRPLIQRIQSGIRLANPMMEEIKREYSEAYGIAYMSNSIFEKYLGCGLGDEETGYLAIHIQLMLENELEKLRTVIVCESGIGVSQLLSVKIEKYFPDLQVIAAMGKEEFYLKAAKLPVDLIIATIPLDSTIPKIQITPLLDEADIAAIKELVPDRMAGIRSGPQLRIRVFPGKDLGSEKEVISFVSEQLLKEGSVTKRFEKAVWERERKISTAIGNRTAIPHAAFDTVLKSCLAVVTTKNPIRWGREPVDLVVFIALRADEAPVLTKRIKQMYYVLFDEDTHARIVKEASEERIKSLLKLVDQHAN